MAKRLKGLSGREHLVLGDRLCEMRDQIVAVMIIIDRAYGKQAGKRARQVYDRLNSLRCWLDDQVCGEYPREVGDIEGVPITKVYYGWREGEGPVNQEDLDRVNNARELLTRAAEQVFAGGNPWRP